MDKTIYLIGTLETTAELLRESAEKAPAAGGCSQETSPQPYLDAALRLKTLKIELETAAAKVDQLRQDLEVHCKNELETFSKHAATAVEHLKVKGGTHHVRGQALFRLRQDTVAVMRAQMAGSSSSSYSSSPSSSQSSGTSSSSGSSGGSSSSGSSGPSSSSSSSSSSSRSGSSGSR